MKRAVFLVLVFSVVLNAALGIYALLAGEFGELEQKILYTSLAVSGAGALALACGPAWERRLAGPLPLVGAGAAVGSLLLLAAAIWSEIGGDSPFWRTTGTLIVVAVTAAYGCLLALARVAPRYRWLLVAAVSLSVVLAGMVVAMIWTGGDSDTFGRALGVVAVLVAAFTVLVPIFHRASRAELAAAAPVQGPAVRFCPCCGRPVEVTVEEETACEGCGARFSVRVLGTRAKAA